MSVHKFASWALLSLLGLVVLGVVSAFAAANAVPLSRVTNQVFVITANSLKPPECTMDLEAIVVIGAGQSPANGKRNELIIGTPNNDVIDGRPGDDCILGGGGNDILDGGPGNGNDVLIGGPGSDTCTRGTPIGCEN